MTHLPDVDKIVVIKDGTISEVGTYKELLAQKGAFAEILVHFLSQELDDKIDTSQMEIKRWYRRDCKDSNNYYYLNIII